eukprot:Awhi_evm1s765
MLYLPKTRRKKIVTVVVICVCCLIFSSFTTQKPFLQQYFQQDFLDQKLLLSKEIEEEQQWLPKEDVIGQQQHLQEQEKQLQEKQAQQPPQQPPEQQAKASKKEELQELRDECDNLSKDWNIRNIHQVPSDICERLKISCGLKTCQAAVDMVIPWVNGTDPVWQKKMQQELARNQKHKGQKAMRFREFGQIRYLLRSLEMYTSNVTRRIYIVACDQWPDFLVSAESTLRLRYISHRGLYEMKYGSEAKKDSDWYSFNSVAIQHMFPFIPTLSELYMSLDDDFLFLKNLSVNALYNRETGKAVWDAWKWKPVLRANRYKNGLNDHNQYLPLEHDEVAEFNQFERSVHLPWWQHGYNVAQKLPPHQKCVQDNRGACYIPQHGPMPLFKSLLKRLWEDNEQDFSHMIHYHKFRLVTDPEMTKDTKPNILTACLNDKFEDMSEKEQREIMEKYEEMFDVKASFEK